MRRWRDVTFGQAFDSLSEYRPVIVLLAGILILALIVPGTGGREVDELRNGPAAEVDRAPTDVGGSTTPGAATGADATGVERSTGTQGSGSVVSVGTGDDTAAPTEAGGASEPQDTGPAPGTQWANADPMSAPDCDPETGRIAIPSFYAPDCVPLWPEGADNGGATYQGVTGDTIRVAIYDSETDDQTAAILADAGAETDDREQSEQDADRDFVYETLGNIFETYGRTVEWVRLEASGEPDDATAARADAIRAAEEMKVFAVFGAPSETNAFTDELAHRGVLCFCTVSQPHFSYERWAPHVYTTLMASTNAYLHRAEYIGKKLWGKPPEHSPDPNFALEEQRRFAVVYFETDDEAFGPGVDFFEEELAKYGAHLDDRLATLGGHTDPAGAQQQAGSIVQRLKDKGITSVIFAGDPFYPIFLTQEATQQQYFPEWIISGSVLSDTAFFARTYDQQQWQNAFGVSFLPARMSPAYRDDEPNLVEWACECEREEYPGVSRTGSLVRFLSGVHLAGPNLNPQTFRDGMFSWSGKHENITRLGFNYGPGIYPWDDYTWFDDTTEIWWDPQAQGEDEIGTEGFGLYRYVRGGLRFLPGQQDDANRAFEEDGTVFWYDERPPGEETEKYASRSTREEPFERSDSW